MKKIVILLLFFVYIIACENQLESFSAKEKKVKINVFNDKKNYEEVKVLDDDGMIYVNLENFKKLISYISDFQSVKSNGKEINYISGDYDVRIDFQTKLLTRTLIENDKKLTGNKNEDITEIYRRYALSFKNKKVEQKAISYEGEHLLLYDILNFSNMSMVRDSVDCKEIMIANTINNPSICMTKKTNEASYEILKKEVDSLIKMKLIDKENRQYLLDNKEKFVNNFYKEMIQYVKKVNRGHFAVYASVNHKGQENGIQNTFCGLKIGDKSYSEKNNTSVKILATDIAYMKINSFFGEDVLFNEFEKAFDSIKNSKNLIIDLRNNLGGYVINELYLLSLLTNKDITEYFITDNGNKKYMIPNPSLKEYKGNLMLLINKHSISASNTFANTVKINKLGTIIGEKSGGQSDPIDEMILPNGMKITKSTLRLYTDDKFQSIDNGIEPDIFIEDVAKGNDNDPILTKAINLCK